MLPVLFSIGPLSVSSFGLFLALAFLFATYLIWRLARAWDLDEEKILDLLVLTFLGGFVIARVYFVLQHIDFFAQDFTRAFLVTKYPGLSFWGAFLGGWLTLYLFSWRQKLDFWQVADVSSVGLVGGLILGNLGCLLGGCNAGGPSSLFLAVPQIGLIGKRLPVQLFEAAGFLALLLHIWPQATHFHFRGKIVSLSLIYIGVIKFLLEPFKETPGEGYIYSTVLVSLGVTIFYLTSKRQISKDLSDGVNAMVRFITDKKERAALLSRLNKSWYNHKVNWLVKYSTIKKILRRVNVNPTPKNFKNY